LESWIYILEYFFELHNKRSSNGYGPNPISYSEIVAWDRLTNKYITAEEVELIMKIDNIYLEHYAATMSKK
jgi:hypothetical protein